MTKQTKTTYQGNTTEAPDLFLKLRSMCDATAVKDRQGKKKKGNDGISKQSDEGEV